MRKKKENRVSAKETLCNVGFVMKYLFRVNKGLYFVRIPLLFLNTASSLVSIFFLRIILNELTNGGEVKTVLLFAAGLAGANFAVSLLLRYFDLYDKRQLEKTNTGLRILLAKAVAKMPFSDIEDPRMKDFISLAESSNSFSAVIEYATGFLGAVINVGTYATIVLTVQPLILILIVVVVVLQIVLNRLKRNTEYKWRVKQAPIYRKMLYYMNIFGDLHYGKEIRVYHLQEYFAEKGKAYFEESYIPNLKKSAFEGEGLSFITEASKVLQKFFLYLILGVKVVFDGMRIGDFSLYISSVDNLTNGLSGLVECYSNLMTCGIFAKEFRYCISVSEKKQETYGTEVLPENATLTIEFRNVSFRYPHTENFVLKNISFQLNAGERLSLVGVNGSGKSTLVKLICRFYEPTEGDVFIGGVNLKTLSADEYSRLLGVVFQDFKLFSFSIRENISMDMDADEEKLHYSIENSGLKNKVESLQNGVETYVYKEFDENGFEFSGGEGQKLAIARAVYKDAPIIILDEPTAALDPIAEHEVYSHFNSLSAGKTAIYISHRLSSTRFTDKIAVLHEGELVEYGSHKELMKKENGRYKEMFSLQMQYYT